MSKFPPSISLPESVRESRLERRLQMMVTARRGIILRSVIIIAELLGFVFLNSSALLLDSLSSLIDIAASLFLIFCIKIADKPPDRNHPFGHGRFEPIAGLQLGLLLTVIGGGMLFQQLTAITAPTDAKVIQPLTWLIPLGAVVAIKQDTIADQSVVEIKKLRTLFDLKLVPHSQYPYKNGWLINLDKNSLKQTGLKTVNGISVNQISTSKEIIKFYRDEFSPVTESMEGAALHYVCLMENVPFLQIRSISNYIGERNKKKWDMKDSIYNLNQSLVRIINNY